MQNECIFSPDRRYRYILRHTWEPLFEPKLCTWIGLNPSIACETRLDKTLTRIRSFCSTWGFNGFIMTNLFALVSTDPQLLYTTADPVGPDNDRYIVEASEETQAVYLAWGVHGIHQNRSETVFQLIARLKPLCLKQTLDGFPIHPLYVPGTTEPIPYVARQQKSKATPT
jgi:hypothetical protein